MDLPSAMQAVRESGCLVYLDSASYLTRSARGVLELYAAAQARVPVVAIRLVGPRTPFTPFHPPRSAGWTLGYLRWLDDKERGLDSWAPGSGGVCRALGVDLGEAAWRLCTQVAPWLAATVRFDPRASRAVMAAETSDLVHAMACAAAKYQDPSGGESGSGGSGGQGECAAWLAARAWSFTAAARSF